MEKKRSHLNKEIDKEHGVIHESQALIRQAELDLADKQHEAEMITQKIAEQEQRVEGVKSKMNGVKK